MIRGNRSSRKIPSGSYCRYRKNKSERDYQLYLQFLQSQLQEQKSRQQEEIQYTFNSPQTISQSYETQEDILCEDIEQEESQIVRQDAKFEDMNYSLTHELMEELKYNSKNGQYTNNKHQYQRSIMQNTKLYNLRIRLRKYEKLNLKDNENLFQLNQYFKYQGSKRSLVSNKLRKKEENIINVSIDLLIDEKKSRTCDIVRFLFQEMNHKSEEQINDSEDCLSQMAIKILYIFQKYFIKKTWNLEKRKKYRKCCNDITSTPKKSKYSQESGFKIKSIQSERLQKEISKEYKDYSSQKMLVQQIWDQYLDLMPKDYSSMPYMQCNLKFFQGDHELQSRCTSKRSSIQELYKNLKKMIDFNKLKKFYIKEYGEKKGSEFNRLISSLFRLDNICWCYNVISTRTFSVHLQQQHKYKTYKQMSFLSPYIDLLNHSEDPNCEWGYNEDQDCFYLMSSRQIQVGQELTIRYGSISNLNLFINYGICCEQNQEQSGIILDLKIANIFSVQNEKDIFKKLFIIRGFYPQIEDYVQREQSQKQIVVERNGNLSIKLNIKNKQIYIKSALKKLLLSFYCTYFTKARGVRGQRFDSHLPKEMIGLLKSILKQMQIKIAEKKEIKLRKMQFTSEKSKSPESNMRFSGQFYQWLLKEQIQICDQLDAYLEQEYLMDENGLIQLMKNIF